MFIKIDYGEHYMKHQQQVDFLTKKLWNIMEEKDWQRSTDLKIIRTIINSKNEDTMTEEIIKIMEMSQTEQEFLKKIEQL